MITEDIGQKSTDNYEQVPNAATNDELSHSLGQERSLIFMSMGTNRWRPSNQAGSLTIVLRKPAARNPIVLRWRVCGELVLKPRQADDIGPGSDCASGRNLDLQPSVVSSQFFHWVCHRSTHNGTAARCRTP